MVVQCLSVEQQLDISGGVCEPRHDNGSTEYLIAVCHLFLLLTVPPQHIENFSKAMEMM
jgi:hypothetical protein